MVRARCQIALQLRRNHRAVGIPLAIHDPWPSTTCRLVLQAGVDRLAARLGAGPRYVHLDVAEEDRWQQAVELAEREFGRVDLRVNNAGVLDFGTIAEHSPKRSSACSRSTWSARG